MPLSRALLLVGLARAEAGSAACWVCAPDTWTPLSQPVHPNVQRGRKFSAEIILSHCRFRIRWLASARAELSSCGFETRAITVYTKCGKLDVGAPAGAKVICSPNRGRNDEAYARHLATGEQGFADVVLFLKDSLIGGSSAEFRKLRVGFCDLARAAVKRGFACGRRPIPSSTPGGRSDFHDSALLAGFQMPVYATTHDQARGTPTVPFNATVRPLAAWLRAVDERVSRRILSSRILPVCYGGTFSAARARIAAVPPTVWRRFADGLSRGRALDE